MFPFSSISERDSCLSCFLIPNPVILFDGCVGSGGSNLITHIRCGCLPGTGQPLVSLLDERIAEVLCAPPAGPYPLSLWHVEGENAIQHCTYISMLGRIPFLTSGLATVTGVCLQWLEGCSCSQMKHGLHNINENFLVTLVVI